MERRLLYLAQRTYRLPKDRAVELVRASCAAHRELRRRDPSADGARALVEAFRDRCRHDAARVADGAPDTPVPSLLVLAALRPPTRAVFRLITERRLTRRQVAERLAGPRAGSTEAGRARRSRDGS